MDWKRLIFSKYVVWTYVLVLMLLAVLPLNSSGSLNNITLIRIRDSVFHLLEGV